MVGAVSSGNVHVVFCLVTFSFYYTSGMFRPNLYKFAVDFWIQLGTSSPDDPRIFLQIFIWRSESFWHIYSAPLAALLIPFEIPYCVKISNRPKLPFCWANGLRDHLLTSMFLYLIIVSGSKHVGVVYSSLSSPLQSCTTMHHVHKCNCFNNTTYCNRNC